MNKEIRKEILEFAEQMEMVMQENDGDKGDSWKNLSIDFLDEKIDEEFYEWFESGDKAELIDIANVAMMLWHRLTDGDE